MDFIPEGNAYQDLADAMQRKEARLGSAANRTLMQLDCLMEDPALLERLAKQVAFELAMPHAADRVPQEFAKSPYKHRVMSWLNYHSALMEGEEETPEKIAILEKAETVCDAMDGLIARFYAERKKHSETKEEQGVEHTQRLKLQRMSTERLDAMVKAEGFDGCSRSRYWDIREQMFNHPELYHILMDDNSPHAVEPAETPRHHLASLREILNAKAATGLPPLI